MGFLNTAAAKLAAGVEKNAEKWLDVGVENLRTKVAPAVPLDGGEAVVLVVADKLDSAEGKAALRGLTYRGVTEITSYLALGADEEAHFAWLREQASFNEAQDALKAAMRDALRQNADDAAQWARTKAFLLDVLKAAGQAAIPILLAML